MIIRALFPLLLVCAGLMAGEGGGFDLDAPTKPAEEEQKEAPVAAPAPQLRALSHTQATGSITAFAAARQLKLTKYGAGPVRLWLVGDGAVPDAAELIALGEQTLQGMEIWTGKQAFFTPTNEAGNFHVVLFAQSQDYASWLDQSRADGIIGKQEGEDLAKKLEGTPFPRGMTKTLAKVAPILRHFMVYAVCCAATDTFYYERGGDSRNHCWLREGLAAEMQRLLCDGQVRCYTISYEDSSIKMQEDWAKTMAEMITKGDKKSKTVRPTSEIMSFTPINMPAANYVQMWSLCTYMRILGGSKKGADNGFAKLISATANGTASDKAVKAAFGKEDPVLSRVWMEWAAAYRSDPKGQKR